jgi:putative tryptophan/tyrosine transport system substrate-binding protein
MRRREFIGLFGGVVALPLARARLARAQQADRMRRLGVLMHTTSDEPESQTNLAAFLQGLQEAGWAVGRNLRIDYRWSGADRVRLRRNAVELIALNPDVVLAGAGATTAALREASRTVPIVFSQNIDPVGTGSVASLSRPGTNATGFSQFEYSLSAKWLELLTEIAPDVKRVAVFRDSDGSAGIGQWAVIQSVASVLGVELTPLDPRETSEMEGVVAALAQAGNSGLIVAVSSAALIHRERIVALAARHKLPAVYPYRFYVAGGGLLSYGPDLTGLYRRAATYVDRILKGAKPTDLPVQNPTKYELAVNLKTARALGLTVPTTLLARADEVIE